MRNMSKVEKEMFLWRKISEQEKEEIKKQAKKIMDDFASALEKAKFDQRDYKTAEAEEQTRDEDKTKKANKDFKKIFFRNAPKKSLEYIEAEKGEWK